MYRLPTRMKIWAACPDQKKQAISTGPVGLLCLIVFVAWWLITRFMMKIGSIYLEDRAAVEMRRRGLVRGSWLQRWSTNVEKRDRSGFLSCWQLISCSHGQRADLSPRFFPTASHSRQRCISKAYCCSFLHCYLLLVTTEVEHHDTRWRDRNMVGALGYGTCPPLL